MTHDERFSALDHTQIAIPRGSEEQAREFYVGVLGFEEVQKPSELAGRGGLWLRSGAAVLHLGIDLDFHAATKAHPAFRCTSFDTFVSHLAEQNVQVTFDQHLFAGKRHCYVNDPFGNRLEFIEE